MRHRRKQEHKAKEGAAVGGSGAPECRSLTVQSGRAILCWLGTDSPLFVTASALSPGKYTSPSLVTSTLGLSIHCQKERTECSGRQTCRISSLLPFVMLCQLPRTAPSSQFIFLDIILEKAWEEGNLYCHFYFWNELISGSHIWNNSSACYKVNTGDLRWGAELWPLSNIITQSWNGFCSSSLSLCIRDLGTVWRHGRKSLSTLCEAAQPPTAPWDAGECHKAGMPPTQGKDLCKDLRGSRYIRQFGRWDTKAFCKKMAWAEWEAWQEVGFAWICFQKETYTQHLVLLWLNLKSFGVFHLSESPISSVIWLCEAFSLQLKIILLVLWVVEKSFATDNPVWKLNAWSANCIPWGNMWVSW